MNNLREIAKSSVLGKPVRFGIMLYLLPREKALFIDLQRVLDITPGNLDSHLRKLQQEGYVEIRKILADRPRTMVKITDIGAYETTRYLEKLKKAISSLL